MNKIWTEEEKTFIKENSGHMKDLDIARYISRDSGRHVSLQAVRKQRQKMGIAKKPGRGICEIAPEMPEMPEMPEVPEIELTLI